jgi:hypothetical protein
VQIDGKLDEILAFIDSARTMPMSSSAMINKGELTALIADLRELLPHDLQAADAVLAEREAILEEARYNAERMLADARAEQAKLVADHEITAEARDERLRLLDAAQESADAIRKGVDAHVDAKLAALERAAAALVDTARNGRQQLAAAAAYRNVESVDEDHVMDDQRFVPDVHVDVHVGGHTAAHAATHTGAHSGEHRFVPDVGDFRA